MEHAFKSYVEELESLFGGRQPLMEVCQVTKTSISTWKQTGIPENQFHRIGMACVSRGFDLPDWFYTKRAVATYENKKATTRERVPA